MNIRAAFVPFRWLGVLIACSTSAALADHAQVVFASNAQRSRAVVAGAKDVEACAIGLALRVQGAMVSPSGWARECTAADRQQYSQALFAAYDLSASARGFRVSATPLLNCPDPRVAAQIDGLRRQFDGDFLHQLQRSHGQIVCLADPHGNPVVHREGANAAVQELARLHELSALLSRNLAASVRVPRLRSHPPVPRPRHRQAPRVYPATLEDEHGELICPFWTGKNLNGTDLRVRLLVTLKNNADYQRISVQVVNPVFEKKHGHSGRRVDRIDLSKNGRTVWTRKLNRNEASFGSRVILNTADYPGRFVERIAGPNLYLRSTGERYLGYSGLLVRHNPGIERGSVVLRLYDNKNQVIDSWVTDFPAKKSAVW